VSDPAGLPFGHGPRDAAIETPARRPRSARRTSSISMFRPAGPNGDLMLVGRARDVVTVGDGSGSVVAEAQVTAVLDGTRCLRSLDAEPDGDAVATLVGSPVASGFRRLADAAVPQHRLVQSPLYLLLDDLPVAALISGYADMYFRPDLAEDRPRGHPKADICSGWRSGGTMMSAIRDHGRIPIPIGPAAPPLELPGDELAWHQLDPLPKGAMRRHRRLDVYGDAPVRVDAMFRDTHVNPDGLETVLHEYSVEATVDAEVDATLHDSLRIVSIDATPRVLPWVECPWAADSAQSLRGEEVTGLRRFVRDSLYGTETCTHLNDMLRSLADVAPLVALIHEI
jgi:hypothetical protein